MPQAKDNKSHDDDTTAAAAKPPAKPGGAARTGPTKAGAKPATPKPGGKPATGTTASAASDAATAPDATMAAKAATQTPASGEVPATPGEENPLHKKLRLRPRDAGVVIAPPDDDDNPLLPLPKSFLILPQPGDLATRRVPSTTSTSSPATGPTWSRASLCCVRGSAPAAASGSPG